MVQIYDASNIVGKCNVMRESNKEKYLNTSINKPKLLGKSNNIIPIHAPGYGNL